MTNNDVIKKTMDPGLVSSIGRAVILKIAEEIEKQAPEADALDKSCLLLSVTRRVADSTALTCEEVFGMRIVGEKVVYSGRKKDSR